MRECVYISPNFFGGFQCAWNSIHDVINISIFYPFSLLFSFTRSFINFSLKMDCEKLMQEKTEMQRHYVMVSTNFTAMSAGLVNKNCV